MTKQLPRRWPFGAGAMAERVRSHDWGRSALGPIDSWPERLKAAVDTCLGSALPTFVWWGPDLVQIHNDAAAEMLRTERPEALGRCARDVWTDIWPVVGPLADGVASTGEAVRIDDLPMRGDAAQGTRQARFTASLGPLPDAGGRIAGMLVTAIETAAASRSDQSFRALFAAAPTPLLVLAPDAPRYTVVEVNDAYLQATMTDRDRLLGRALFEVFPDNPDDPSANGVAALSASLGVAALSASLERVLATGRSDSVAVQRYDIPRPDGSFEERYWLSNSKPVIDASGRVGMIIHHMTDLTEQYRAQAALRASESRFRGVAEQLAVGIAMTDMGGCFIYVNDRYCDNIGRSREQVIGRSVEALTHPDDWPRNRPLASRLRIDGEPFVIEKRYLRPDGSIIWVRNSVSARRDAQGRIIGGLVVSIDLTDRIRAEEALRESEARFRLLVESAAQAVWETDAEGSVAADSPSWRSYTGQSIDQWLGNRWIDAIHPEDRDEVRHRWSDAMVDKQPLDLEFRIRHRDGGWCWTNLRAAPLMSADGSVHRWVGMNLDVTERRQAEEALREADRRKDEFLAMLAHELRNPLAPVRNALALFDREPLTGRGQQALEMSRRQLSQLTRLVDDLLEVSRITRGWIEVRPEPLEVRQIVRQVLEGIGPSMDQRRQRIVLDLPREPVPLVADPVRLAQIVENLLTNASKYSEAGGEIRLRVRQQRDEVVIDVEDAGIGIAAEHLPRLFELFTQLESTIDRSRGGLGIGLALVKRLAELHGGSVRARSEGLGRGASFTVRLPNRSAAQPESD